jgi:hypothetical protein
MHTCIPPRGRSSEIGRIVPSGSTGWQGTTRRQRSGAAPLLGFWYSSSWSAWCLGSLPRWRIMCRRTSSLLLQRLWGICMSSLGSDSSEEESGLVSGCARSTPSVSDDFLGSVLSTSTKEPHLRHCHHGVQVHDAFSASEQGGHHLLHLLSTTTTHNPSTPLTGSKVNRMRCPPSQRGR